MSYEGRWAGRAHVLRALEAAALETERRATAAHGSDCDTLQIVSRTFARVARLGPSPGAVQVVERLREYDTVADLAHQVLRAWQEN